MTIFTIITVHQQKRLRTCYVQALLWALGHRGEQSATAHMDLTFKGGKTDDENIKQYNHKVRSSSDK